MRTRAEALSFAAGSGEWAWTSTSHPKTSRSATRFGAFIAENYPAAPARPTTSARTRWQGRLSLLAPDPGRRRAGSRRTGRRQYGGTDWTPTQKYIWSEELARADTLAIMPFGISMVGAGDLHLRHGRAEGSASCPAATAAKSGGARAIPSPARARTWPRCARGRVPGRRLLHRQRPEDLDHDGPVRRLGLLPGPHRPDGQAAGGHQLPADRHEDARASPSGRSSPWRAATRSTTSSSTTCSVPVENRIYEENQGWTAPRPAAPRALRHRRRSPAPSARIEHLRSMASTEAGDDARPLLEGRVLQAQGRRAGDRPDRAGVHRAAHARRRDARARGPGRSRRS